MLNAATVEGKIAAAAQIYDESLQCFQEDINEAVPQILTELLDKYGYMRITDPDSQTGLFSFEFFASEDSANLYDDDPITNADLLLQTIQFPISTIKESYEAFLRSTISNTASIVTASNDLIVPLNYRAVKVGASGNTNVMIPGSIVVQRKTATTDWVTVDTLDSELPSNEPDDTETYKEINFGKYLQKGSQMLRVYATYEYEDKNGDKQPVRSGYVMIGESVTLVELRLETVTQYHMPLVIRDNVLPIQYRVYGATQKTLKIEFRGNNGSDVFSVNCTASEDDVTKEIQVANNTTLDFFGHGIREVKAWLECSDGMGGVLMSEVQNNQFMMVNVDSPSYVAGKKYLLLQNIQTSVTNYIQSTICDYAVYSEDDSDTNVKFKLTDDQTTPTTYLEVNKVVKSNTANKLTATVEIEASSDEVIGFSSRFWVWRDDVNNFIYDSGHYNNLTGKRREYYDIYVDNSQAIMPIGGSTFLLNPKSRDNKETNPEIIYNERADNAIVESTWENFGFINDGWMTDNLGQKVLRIMAGEKLTIKKNIWSQFLKNPNSSLTIDIDYKISNVTDLENPVVSILGGVDKGIVLNSLTGWVKTASYNDTNNCNFSWREDKRQFLSVNIHNAVKPKKGDHTDVSHAQDAETIAKAKGTIALARVLLNGDPVREIPFDTTSSSEWCDDPNASIIIGNDGADIDIYSIRIYEQTQLEMSDLFNRNYLASIPTTEEKMRIKMRNDILTGGLISLDKAKLAGYNCIIYHGKRPSKGSGIDSTTDGWIEYARYDQDGNFLPQFSGKNCAKTGKLGWKKQGTTASYYYEYNEQDDNSKVEATIEVLIARNPDSTLPYFHESIHVSEPYELTTTDESGVATTKTVVDIYGGNLGKNFPLTNDTKAYPYRDGKVTVPDGWVDGNGAYRGMGYQVNADCALAQKKVAKINYASAMQSHLLGACKSYDELHHAVVGKSPLQTQYYQAGLARPVSAKHTEPFLMFFDEDGAYDSSGEWKSGNIYYVGLCIYGAGKMDKVSWGYVKGKHPMFTMIEGSDNGTYLSDFRVPFDNKVIYLPNEEGYALPIQTADGVQNQISWDFDAGKTNDDDTPDADIDAQIRRFCNFVYLNSPNLQYFVGNVAAFKAAANNQTLDTKKKYWCTAEATAQSVKVNVYRYDPTISGDESEKWVHAGIDGAEINLVTDVRTSATMLKFLGTTDYDSWNTELNQALATFMKRHGKYFINLDSLLFNYVYVLMFLAGTDNSSKNTYYKLDPIPQQMAYDEQFAAWWNSVYGEEFNFDAVYQFYMDGDDMDSILPVDNKGNLTKPYYIERLYPYDDNNPTESLYMGMDNQLFDFVEIAYSNVERSNMMHAILVAMQSLISNNDKLFGLSSGKVSAWGFLHKYFFNVQYYFPQIAYIEQARIRYEFAELMGHKGARDVRPVSQSIGSQVENEQQFMEQRLILMASFGSFGEFGSTSGGGGTIGIQDAIDNLNFTPAPLPNGTPATITLTVTPHQYIYPISYSANGGSILNPLQRTSPKQTCTITIVTNVADETDDTAGLRGANYYSDYGNLGTLSATNSFEVKGKRLTTLSIGATDNKFRPSNLTISAPFIKNISCGWLSTDVSWRFDLSALIRLNIFSNTSPADEYIFPQTHTLRLIRVLIFNTISSFTIENVPNLKTLEFTNISAQFGKNLKTFIIGKNVGVGTGLDLTSHVLLLKQYSTPLTTLRILNNFTWSDLDASIMEWMLGIKTLDLKGRISIASTDSVGNKTFLPYDTVIQLIDRFGNIQSTSNSLYVDYPTSQIRNFSIIGDKYIRTTGLWQGWGIKIAQKNGNDVLVNTATNKEAVTWSFVDDADNVVTSSNVTWVNTTKGYVLVNSLTTTPLRLRVQMQTKNGTVSTYKTVGFYDRVPQLGDIAYVDGQFDNEYDPSKSIAGVVVKRDEVSHTYADGTVGTAYIAHVWAKENQKITSTDSTLNTASLPYGIFAQEKSSDTGSTVGFSSATVADIETATGVSVDDISGIVNTSPVGLTKVVDGVTVAHNYLTDTGTVDTITGYGQYIDLDAEDGSGYRKFANTVAVGHFTEGEGAEIINVANNVISEVVGLSSLPTTGTELANAIVEYETSKAGDDNPSRYRQFFYPAEYACYTWQPATKEGETLAKEYTRGNWHLPNIGLLCRIYNFYLNSCGTTAEDGSITTRLPLSVSDGDGNSVSTGATISAAYANEEPTHEALLPLFANLIARGATGDGDSGLFVLPSTSRHWSSSESGSLHSWYVYFDSGGVYGYSKFGSGVGRGVAAFTFVPVQQQTAAQDL